MNLEGNDSDRTLKASAERPQPWYRLTLLESLVVVSIIVILVSCLLPFVRSGGHPPRIYVRNQMKEIGLAMHNYESAHLTLPDTAIRDENGKALLSWRVSLLPYLEHDELFNQFKLDESWDSEHNKKLIPLVPSVYINHFTYFTEGETYKTNMLLPVSVGLPRSQSTLFAEGRGREMNAITDDPAETIMLVAARSDLNVTWTKPGDLPFNPEDPGYGVSSGEKKMFMVLMADRSVKVPEEKMTPEKLLSLFTYAGNDHVAEKSAEK